MMWLHGPFLGGFPFFLVFLVMPLLVLAAFWIRRGRRGPHGPGRGGCAAVRPGRGLSHPESNARELLDQRYARGEIDREQYLRMKEDLG